MGAEKTAGKATRSIPPLPALAAGAAVLALGGWGVANLLPIEAPGKPVGGEAKAEAATTVQPSKATIPRLDLTELDPRMSNQISAAIRRAEESLTATNLGELGLSYHAHRYIDLARQCYEMALQLDNGSRNWPYYLGMLAAERGQHDDAVRYFRLALANGEDTPSLRDRLGNVLLAKGELSDAEKQYAELADSHRAHLGSARVALSRDDDESALRLLRQAYGVEPSDRTSVYLLATTLRRLGHGSEARPLLTSLADLDEIRPADPMVDLIYTYRADLELMLKKGSAHLERGQPELAEAEYRAILELDPEHVDALFNLGVLLGRSERFQEAEQLLRRAVQAEPARTDTRLMLAMSFASQGRIPDAMRELERLLEIDPTNERALQLLASRPE